MNSSNDEYVELVQQIHELVSAVLGIYETIRIDGILPPAILHDIGEFAEYVKSQFDLYLQKLTFRRLLNRIHSCLKTRQGYGKLKRLLKLSENQIQLKLSKEELQVALEKFRVSSFQFELEKS